MEGNWIIDYEIDYEFEPPENLPPGLNPIRKSLLLASACALELVKNLDGSTSAILSPACQGFERILATDGTVRVMLDIDPNGAPPQREDIDLTGLGFGYA